MSNLSENSNNENALNENELAEISGGSTRGMNPDYFVIHGGKPKVIGNGAEAVENSTPIREMPFK